MGTPAHAGSREISCIRCHGSVGHLELSATNVAHRGEPWLSRSRPRDAATWTRGTVLAVAVLAAVAAAGATALLVNIMERKQEAKNPFFRVVELTDETEDPAIWGKNFPLQYDGYLRTVDQQRTRYGGSEALPHTPTEADPRSVVAQSRLEEDPRLKTMWAGYAFAVDFRKKRGHAYMLEDQTFTERRGEVQAAGHLHPLPRLGVRALQEGGRRRPHQGLRALQPDALHRRPGRTSPTPSAASTATTRRPWRCGSRGPASWRASGR